MLVVAIDPGGTIGIASWIVTPGGPTKEFLGTRASLLDDAMVDMDEIVALAATQGNNSIAIVIELYQTNTRMGFNRNSRNDTTRTSTLLEARLLQKMDDFGVELISLLHAPRGNKDIAFRTPFWRRHIEKHGEPKTQHEKDAIGHGLHWIHMGRGRIIIDRLKEPS